jgi:(2Fe-2S) ferredoxin
MRRRTAEVRDRDASAYLLICTQDRDGLACCADADGRAVLATAREWLDERDALYSAVFPVATSCLGLCDESGTAIGVFPHEEWFSGVTPADVPALLESVFGPAAERVGAGAAPPAESGTRLG